MFPFAASFTLNCEYFYVSESRYWAHVLPAYYCYVEGITVETPETSVTEVKGSHKSGYSNKDVNTLWISNSPNALYLPKGVEKFFNIEAIQFKNTGLKSLTQGDLSPFPDLSALWMYSNKLTSLDSGLFAFNPKMRYMDFGNNKLSSVSADLFEPIKKLETAYFNKNICIKSDASTPGQLKELEKKFQEGCQKGKVVANCKTATWNNFGSVYYCEFEGMIVVNSVTFVSEFQGTHLDGKANNDVNGLLIKNSPGLSFFPKRFDKIFSGIKGIEITETGLKAITHDDLRAFPELTALWLSTNKLTTVVPRLFISNPKLKILDFSYNQISKISADLFDPIPQLKIVWLNNNVCIGIDAKTSGDIKTVEKKVLEKCQN